LVSSDLERKINRDRQTERKERKLAFNWEPAVTAFSSWFVSCENVFFLVQCWSERSAAPIAHPAKEEHTHALARNHTRKRTKPNRDRFFEVTWVLDRLGWPAWPSRERYRRGGARAPLSCQGRRRRRVCGAGGARTATWLPCVSRAKKQHRGSVPNLLCRGIKNSWFFDII